MQALGHSVRLLHKGYLNIHTTLLFPLNIFELWLTGVTENMKSKTIDKRGVLYSSGHIRKVLCL
jgi:hypothetical protein